MTISADFGQSLTREEAAVAVALSETDGHDDGSMWAIGTEALDLVARLHANGRHICPGADCPHESHAVPLPERARTRTGDPDTSRTAAANIGPLSPHQEAVLSVAQTLSAPWTLDAIVWIYQSRQKDGLAELPLITESGIRSRVKDLRDNRRIVKAGMGTSDAGNPAQTWIVARPMEAVA